MKNFVGAAVLPQLLYGKPMEHLKSVTEERLKGGEQQSLAETARACKEILPVAVSRQLINQRGLVNIELIIFPQ
ncbi:MAG: hypothetical protein SPL69_06825 [Succinivibrionaceae bacterium]|nr:hypothetical protein [Succinivibrionaceae bacterium]MDY6375814.1 hypothetical protein [Succinivibrionaceae bacterium]